MAMPRFPWRLVRLNRTPPPQEALQAPWMTSSSWWRCAMTSHTGPRLGRDQWISPIVLTWEDHFEGILAFFLRKFHWRLDSLVYIWLSRTEPWIASPCMYKHPKMHSWMMMNSQKYPNKIQRDSVDCWWGIPSNYAQYKNMWFQHIFCKNIFCFRKKDVNVHPLKWMIALESAPVSRIFKDNKF